MNVLRISIIMSEFYIRPETIYLFKIQNIIITDYQILPPPKLVVFHSVIYKVCSNRSIFSGIVQKQLFNKMTHTLQIFFLVSSEIYYYLNKPYVIV